MNAHAYDTDVLAWSREQARLLREGRFDQIDIEHIADEVEDVGKSEQRELANRMAILMAHLLKWQHQPGRRGASWQATLREQRRAIAIVLRATPSLRGSLGNADWLAGTWADAAAKAIEETGLSAFPESCPWSMDQVLDAGFFPA